MSNEVVKYHNKMNEIAFRKFTSIELDMFFSICYKMKKSILILLNYPLKN